VKRTLPKAKFLTILILGLSTRMEYKILMTRDGLRISLPLAAMKVEVDMLILKDLPHKGYSRISNNDVDAKNQKTTEIILSDDQA